MKHKYYYRIQYNNGESLMVLEGITVRDMYDDARVLAKKYPDVIYWTLPVDYENHVLFFRKVTFNGANEGEVGGNCVSSRCMLTGLQRDLSTIYGPEKLAAYKEALRYYKNFTNNT